jgi:hypothetical protein
MGISLSPTSVLSWLVGEGKRGVVDKTWDSVIIKSV